MRLLDIKCDVCRNGVLYLDGVSTLDFFTEIDLYTYNGVLAHIDKTLDRPMIYKCNNCGELFQYSTKDILIKLREQLLDYFITHISQSNIAEMAVNTQRPSLLVYCGNCPGQDGKGSCSVDIHEKCHIKEFPIG